MRVWGVGVVGSSIVSFIYVGGRRTYNSWIQSEGRFCNIYYVTSLLGRLKMHLQDYNLTD